eukprot:gene11730-5069_t
MLEFSKSWISRDTFVSFCNALHDQTLDGLVDDSDAQILIFSTIYDKILFPDYYKDKSNLLSFQVTEEEFHRITDTINQKYPEFVKKLEYYTKNDPKPPIFPEIWDCGIKMVVYSFLFASYLLLGFGFIFAYIKIAKDQGILANVMIYNIAIIFNIFILASAMFLKNLVEVFVTFTKWCLENIQSVATSIWNRAELLTIASLMARHVYLNLSILEVVLKGICNYYYEVGINSENPYINVLPTLVYELQEIVKVRLNQGKVIFNLLYCSNLPDLPAFNEIIFDGLTEYEEEIVLLVLRLFKIFSAI